jgi:glycerol-3-phosphate acyltransferase PlsY
MVMAQLHAPEGVMAGLCLAFGYLLGSIPFGLIITRLGGAGDIRQIGSGNIGATNVLRTGRRELAALTLVADMGKAAVAVLLGGAAFGQLGAVLAGGAAFVGHLFPVWLGFRGGKGVACFFGVLLSIAWPVGLAAGAIWIAMAAIFRMSSLAALTAAAVSPFLFLLFGDATTARLTLAAGMAALIFVRHHENIGRLLRNEEPRIGRAKPAS